MIDDTPPLALSSLLTCTHNPTLFTANWTTLQIPSLRLWSTKLATDNCPELVQFMNVQNCHAGKVSLIQQRLLKNLPGVQLSRRVYFSSVFHFNVLIKLAGDSSFKVQLGRTLPEMGKQMFLYIMSPEGQKSHCGHKWGIT